MTIASAEPTDSRRSHWVRTKRLTVQLMLIWLAATFGIIFFARDLSGLTFFGWPLSYYLAAQGALLLYTAIVGFYAYRMHTLDRDFDREQDDDDVE